MINKIFPYNRFTFLNEHLLEAIPEEALKMIEESKTVLRLKKGQILYHEESFPSGVFIIKKGKVKKYTTGINGKEHIFYLAKENEILGHHTVLSQEASSSTVACLVDCVFELIPEKVFIQLVKNESEILFRLLKSISHEFGVFTINSKILAQHNVRERTALSILKLEWFFNGDGINLSRRDHSNIIGTSVESLTRVLHDFKEEGAIAVEEQHIIVKDMEHLVNASNII